MPLHTQIRRNGEPLSLHWGFWHVQTMMDVACDEENIPRREFNKTTLGRTGKQIVKNRWRCVDPADGEVLLLQPGDELVMHR